MSGVGGFAGLLIASDKEKLDNISAGASIESITAINGIQNSGTATEVILEPVYGALDAGQTATTVMPYDISLLPSI